MTLKELNNRDKQLTADIRKLRDEVFLPMLNANPGNAELLAFTNRIINDLVAYKNVLYFATDYVVGEKD